MKHIFIITALKTIYGYTNSTFGRRTIGWYSDYTNAIHAVVHNYGDMYEEGYYPFCVIEKFAEGIWAIAMKEYWFQWKEGRYQPIDKPEALKQICSFGMG